jgi:hypothetical protein
MVSFARYDAGGLKDGFQKRLSIQVTEGHLSQQEADKLLQHYESAASWTTYLD